MVFKFLNDLKTPLWSNKKKKSNNTLHIKL